MIAPMMIAVMMPVTVIVPPPVEGPSVHGPYAPGVPDRERKNASVVTRVTIVTGSCLFANPLDRAPPRPDTVIRDGLCSPRRARPAARHGPGVRRLPGQ